MRPSGCYKFVTLSAVPSLCSALSLFSFSQKAKQLVLTLRSSAHSLTHPPMEMDFHTLSRRELQALCKKNKIPANMTNVAMADALAALHQVVLCFSFFRSVSSCTIKMMHAFEGFWEAEIRGKKLICRSVAPSSFCSLHL